MMTTAATNLASFALLLLYHGGGRQRTINNSGHDVSKQFHCLPSMGLSLMDDEHDDVSTTISATMTTTTEQRRMYMAAEAAKLMSINELLTLLDGWEVRYPPYATRELLVTIMLCHIRKGTRSNVGGGSPPQGQGQRHNNNSQQRRRASKLMSIDSSDDRTLYKRLDRKIGTTRRSRSRQSDSTTDESENYYTNGLQIFAMGFVEASKTATRLATDAIVDSVGGRKGDDGRSATNVGVRNIDMGETRRRQQRRTRRRRRNVLDVDVIDYSPRQRFKTIERSEGREVNDDDSEEERRKRQGCEDNNESNEERRPPLRKENVNRDDHYRANVNNEVVLSMRSSHRRNIRNYEMEEGTSPKKVYGLYQPNSSIDTKVVKQEESHHEHQQQQQQQQQQRWKDRLRHKFDIALGLEADSLRRQMEGMDDIRKNVLRRQMNKNEFNNYEQRGLSRSDDDPPLVVEPNNRRARMRNRTRAKTDEQRISSSSMIPLSSKTTTMESILSNSRRRLDEVPFWRDGRSIASLLFATRSPSYSGTRNGATRRPMMGGFSLEQLLLSPFGREHTVTSLFLYCSRSAITAFGCLCRWAGVRGTIPQPIVVILVIATVLSSRGGSRAMSLVLTVLAMRLVGEFIHGSLNGNEFWEDEYDRNTHNWKKEVVK